MDARRPWNLSNLFGIALDVDDDGEEAGEGKIWTWGDGDETKLDNVKKSWETLEVSLVLAAAWICSANVQYEPESDSDSDSDEEDDEDDEDEEGTENGHDDEDGEGTDGEIENGVRLGKRSRESSSKPKKRRREGDKVNFVWK
jgi:cell division control protein 45